MPHSPTPEVIRSIRAEMARRGQTQGELAARMNVSRTWISNRLTGAVEPTLSELAAIATAIGVELRDLLFGSPAVQA